MMFERVVKIRMDGIPIVLREEKTFREIAGLFGKVIEPFEFSWDGFDISLGACLVLHSSGRKIDEEVNLIWNNRSYPIWVKEVEHAWPPTLKEPSATATVGDKGVDAEGGAELEEGEFRVTPATGNQELQGEVETIHHIGDAAAPMLHGESQELHAGMGFLCTPRKSRVTEDGIIGGPDHLGPSNQVGLPSVVSSRKRPRFFRSPCSSKSPGGPSHDQSHVPEIPPFPDLNNPAVVGSGSPTDSYHRGFDTQIEGQEGVSGTIVPESQLGIIDQEVVDTIEVGTCIGIQIEPFADQLRMLIEGEEASRLWGWSKYEMEEVGVEGRSGGLLCLWNPGVFRLQNTIKNMYFLIISGRLVGSDTEGHFVNVYAPNDPVSRRNLWGELLVLRNSVPGFWAFFGDFNEVRDPSERVNSYFVALNADKFNRFIGDADLVEYNMGGQKYTYMSDNGRKLSKLDRFLVCRAFVNFWPTASVTALSREYSDHCPILLSTVPHDFGHIPFRFFNSWLDIPGFVDFVEFSARSFIFNGPADLALSTKLRWLKFRIKYWVKNARQIRENSHRSYKGRIAELDVLAEDRDLASSELEERIKCKQELAKFDCEKLNDSRQKSRVRWAIEGDENSRYFHSTVNANLSCSRINGLRFDGVWVSDPALLKDKLKDYFPNKFREPVLVRPSFVCHGIAKLDGWEAANLVERFTSAEIKAAIWDCGGDKAPGPDGYNFRFIKRCWSCFEQDFTRLFSEFYESPHLSLGCCSSFIALIAKVVDPTGAQEFLPVSLIGCINKAISKVLVNRLKGVIGKLISNEQSGFLAGRSILDGPLILNELVAWLRRSKSVGMIFKVDIEKAFDSLNWGFLDSVMAQMNFPEKWRGWIMACVTSARSSVLVNGSPTAEFPCYRGLRQGDPLSPFLFIIAMEALSCFMRRAESLGVYQGIKCTPTGPLLSHFLYADDMVFLGSWSVMNAKNLCRILRCFNLASGLKVNLAKCQLFSVGADSRGMEQIAGILHCSIGSFPFTYLGLKVGANMNLAKHWKPVIDTFRRRLSNWKAKTLSFGGRITLIKSVMNSLPTYFFSLYKAPEQVIRELDRLRRLFLWGGSEDQAKVCCVAWEKVIAPEKFGGLGLVIWAVHNNSRSWNFIPIKLSQSGPWKQIHGISARLTLAGLDLGRLIRGVLGCGRNILFWRDCWVDSVPFSDLYPSLFSLERRKLCCVADRIRSSDGTVVITWGWTRLPSVGSEEDELLMLVSDLASASCSSSSDKWWWGLESNGNFSVSSIRNKLACSPSSTPSYVFDWNSWIPKKVGMVAWRAEKDRLPTAEALIRRNIWVPDPWCAFCGNHLEAADHVLLSCTFAQDVWQVISEWCKTLPFYAADVRGLLGLWKYTNGSYRRKKVVHAIILITIWSIWKLRNSLRFGIGEVSLSNTIEEIKIQGFLWVSNRSRMASISWDQWKSFDASCFG
ncbi:hypothetical protein L1987_44037 [Smallanthus sonchifolius]|uniref:Uncharacterized protein n=1 Tax=Smallanthus sonchifolius TaxID=185202 RepID=A0ACB9GMR3_9ASTR|nr:hypothetical protein L1987_44037 [Smallanthus sonchifolius]